MKPTLQHLFCLLSAASLFSFTAFANSPTPGGKRYFVVSAATSVAPSTRGIAKVAEVTFNGSQNGTYYGASAGRVRWYGWRWNSAITGNTADSSSAVGSGTSVGLDCDQTGKPRRYSPKNELFNNGLRYQQGAVGELRIAHSFAGSATEDKSGDFYLTDTWVHIRWDNGTWEDWDITTASTGIQKLQFRNSNLGYTGGLGAGSNSPFTVRVHPTAIAAQSSFSNFTQCTKATWVMNETHYLDPSNCSCKPSRSYKNDWIWRIGSSDRRDSKHLFCHCLSEGARGTHTWYTGGTHQYPLLQAIDDSGNFRGYVGVRAEPGAAELFNELDF